MARCRIAPYTPADRAAVVTFQEGLWAAGPERNAAYLDWKYRDNPYLDHRYLMLAWSDDGLIGTAGAFGACWVTSDGDRAMLPCLADALVAAPYRGGSLFVRMVEAIEERLSRDGVPWLLDFGNGLAAPSLLLNGWKSIGPWEVALSTRADPRPEHAAWTQAGHRHLRGTRSGVDIHLSHRPDPTVVASLAGHVPLAPGATRHMRDEEYLTWWFSNPLARYFSLTASLREPQGYLVAQRSLGPDDEPTPTTILDCEATTTDVYADLLEVALALLPGAVILIWARDVPPGRRATFGDVGLRIAEPTGWITKDWQLPNLILKSSEALAASSPLAGLDRPEAWDLRLVCGRSWR